MLVSVTDSAHRVVTLAQERGMCALPYVASHTARVAAAWGTAAVENRPTVRVQYLCHVTRFILNENINSHNTDTNAPKIPMQVMKYPRVVELESGVQWPLAKSQNPRLSYSYFPTIRRQSFKELKENQICGYYMLCKVTADWRNSSTAAVNLIFGEWPLTCG